MSQIAKAIVRIRLLLNRTAIKGGGGAGKLLFQRVGHQRQDLLLLIKQQACSKMTKTLVRKSRRRKELQAFDLTEMGSLAQGEEVEEFRDIVTAVSHIANEHSYSSFGCAEIRQ